MAELWTEKYFPKTLSDFVGNNEIVRELDNWARDWNKGIMGKPLLVWGQTGTGKTLLAHLIASVNDWQLFELNASDFRTKDIIEKIAGAAIQSASFFGKKRLVLLDEIDGLQGTADKGGSGAVVSVLKQAKNPVILTANDIYADQKLAAIRGICRVFEFKKINYLSIAKFLEKICEAEKIDYDQESLKLLAKNSAGDMRSAIIDLQTLSMHDNKITVDDVNSLGYRERQEKIFNVLGKIFRAETVSDAFKARSSSEIGGEMLFRWIEENIPRVYTEKDDTANAFERLSKADVFNGRIRKRQHYGFLKYSSELATSGVALSRKNEYHEWVMYQFPKIISYLGKTKATRGMNKQIALKIAGQIHSSAKEVISQDLQFLQLIIEKRENAVAFAAQFDFSEEEIAFLLGSSPSTKKVQEIFAMAQELRKKAIAEARKPLAAVSEETVAQQISRKENPMPLEESETKNNPTKCPVDAEAHKQTKIFGF